MEPPPGSHRYSSRESNLAWDWVNELAEEVHQERTREVEIKREHAERYFESRIEDLDEKLADFRDRQQREGTDMRAPINRVMRELRVIRRERDEEFQRLEEDEQVIPDEPELINAAIVIGI